MIKLNLANEGKWIYDEASDHPDYSPERMVLYYSEALSPEMKTEPLSDTLQIDPSILNDVVIKETTSEDGTVIKRTYEYKYDGYSFHLEAEVNAVQTHNAADAIKSAWGVDVTLSGDCLLYTSRCV